MEKKKESTKKLEMVSLESFPEDIQMIAEIFGIDIALKLSENFGGMRLYIPKHETLLRSIRNQQIKNEFNGRNQRPLARKYNLTETQVRSILQKRV